jgi:hypothetical protein
MHNGHNGSEWVRGHVDGRKRESVAIMMGGRKRERERASVVLAISEMEAIYRSRMIITSDNWR